MSHSDVPQSILHRLSVVEVVLFSPAQISFVLVAKYSKTHVPTIARADTLERPCIGTGVVVGAVEALSVADAIEPLAAVVDLLRGGGGEGQLRARREEMEGDSLARDHSPAMANPNFSVVTFIFLPK